MGLGNLIRSRKDPSDDHLDASGFQRGLPVFYLISHPVYNMRRLGWMVTDVEEYCRDKHYGMNVYSEYWSYAQVLS